MKVYLKFWSPFIFCIARRKLTTENRCQGQTCTTMLRERETICIASCPTSSVANCKKKIYLHFGWLLTHLRKLKCLRNPDIEVVPWVNKIRSETFNFTSCKVVSIRSHTTPTLPCRGPTDRWRNATAMPFVPPVRIQDHPVLPKMVHISSLILSVTDECRNIFELNTKFCHLTPCSLVDTYLRFDWIYCLQHQSSIHLISRLDLVRSLTVL